MNTTQKILVTGIVFLSINIFPMHPDQKPFCQKALCSIATSNPLYWLENKLGVYLSSPIIAAFGNTPATEHYQKLGKEAQTDLGIPEKYHVPIMQMLPNNPLINFVSGIAFPHAIYINEIKLNELPYGVQRCCMYHEAAHKKYNDNTMDDLIGSISFFSTAYGSYKLSKYFLPNFNKYTRFFGVTIFSFSAVQILCSKHVWYRERRADTEGFYATGCATCMQEMMDHRYQKFEVDNHPFKNNGYLWAHDIKSIMEDLQAQNKVCEYHSKQA